MTSLCVTATKCDVTDDAVETAVAKVAKDGVSAEHGAGADGRGINELKLYEGLPSGVCVCVLFRLSVCTRLTSLVSRQVSVCVCVCE